MIVVIAEIASFPARGPYRVDQVHADPLGLFSLFFVQLGLACLISIAARRGRGVWLEAASIALVSLVGLFYAFSSWGLGDVTRLSYFLVRQPDLFGIGEPVWTALGPLIRFLPYRFSFVHGFVAACYAAAGIWLSRRSHSAAWGGWWALMIVYSPLLRNFLQAGITRQALAVVLLMPLMLWCAGGVRMPKLPTGALALTAALVHSSFLLSVAVALSPLLVAQDGLNRLKRVRFHMRHSGRLAGNIILGLTVVALVAWLGLNGSEMAGKLSDYLSRQDYYPQFILRVEVYEVLLSLVFAVLMASRLRGMGIAELTSSTLVRAMILFFVAIILIQFSIQYVWMPQITSRVQDAVGFYLLITFLAWIASVSMRSLSALPIMASISYWLFDRLAFAGLLPCGMNDEFLCVPDRLPWDVIYWP